MEKRDDFYELIIFLITVFVRLIYPLIPLAVFPAYFMLKDDVNTTVEFFLRWACISILAVLVGYFLQSTSIFTSKKDSNNINYIPIYIVAIIQSLALTYLFATHQPNPTECHRSIFSHGFFLSLSFISSGYEATAKTHLIALSANHSASILQNSQSSLPCYPPSAP